MAHLAHPQFPRVTRDRVHWGTLPDGHPLRTIFSQQGIQDRLFGPNSPGGLDRDDYDSMQVLVGRVMSHESQSRITPLVCQCGEPVEVFNNGVMSVRRCQGSFKGDAGDFPRPGELDYRPTNWHRWQDPYWAVNVKRWKRTQTHFPHPTWPKPLMCARCQFFIRQRLQVQRTNTCPYNAINPNLRRWARFCKQHCMQLRNKYPRLWAQRVYVEPRRDWDCRCDAAAKHLYSCYPCKTESDNAWVDRAQHWRNELLHTYVRQKRVNRRKPYVDYTKPARAEPACPWKNCGRIPWITRRTRLDEEGYVEDVGDASKIGLSLCLGCSAIVLA